MWLCAQCRMWKADFMSVGTVPGKGRVECLVRGDNVKTAGKYVHNTEQCICGGIVHNRCINEKTGALCECNLPQVLVHRFKKVVEEPRPSHQTTKGSNSETETGASGGPRQVAARNKSLAHRAVEGRNEWSRRERPRGGEWPGSSATGPPKGRQNSGGHPRPLERPAPR